MCPVGPSVSHINKGMQQSVSSTSPEDRCTSMLTSDFTSLHQTLFADFLKKAKGRLLVLLTEECWGQGSTEECCKVRQGIPFRIIAGSYAVSLHSARPALWADMRCRKALQLFHRYLLYAFSFAWHRPWPNFVTSAIFQYFKICPHLPVNYKEATKGIFCFWKRIIQTLNIPNWESFIRGIAHCNMYLVWNSACDTLFAC